MDTTVLNSAIRASLRNHGRYDFIYTCAVFECGFKEVVVLFDETAFDPAVGQRIFLDNEL